MKISGIYCLRNMANGKVYVGQSVEVMPRILNHFSKLKAGKHYNEHLQRSFEKYGRDGFEFRILEKGIPESLLDDRERLWITYYKSNQYEYGYNLREGGEACHSQSMESRQKISNSNKGKHFWTEEMRRCLSEKKKGIPLTAERRRQMSEANKANPRVLEHLRKLAEARKGTKMGPHSPETRRKIGEANKGIKHTDESRQNMSRAHIGIKHTPESRRKLSETMKGRLRSTEHCQHISEAKKGKPIRGRPCSTETRQKISQALKGKPRKPWSAIQRERYTNRILMRQKNK